MPHLNPNEVEIVEAMLKKAKSSLPINSKQKGKTGELEASKLLKDYGFVRARRGQQYSGVAVEGQMGGEDVVNVPGYFIEVKSWGESLKYKDLRKVMDRAEEDAKESGRKPMIIHKGNTSYWMISLYILLDDETHILATFKGSEFLEHVYQHKILAKLFNELPTEEPIFEPTPEVVCEKGKPVNVPEEVFTEMIVVWIDEVTDEDIGCFMPEKEIVQEVWRPERRARDVEGTTPNPSKYLPPQNKDGAT